VSAPTYGAGKPNTFKEPLTPWTAVAEARREAIYHGKPWVVWAQYGGSQTVQAPKALKTDSAHNAGPGSGWEVVFWVSVTGLERVMGRWSHKDSLAWAQMVQRNADRPRELYSSSATKRA
jgi:hypothetical protein